MYYFADDISILIRCFTNDFPKISEDFANYSEGRKNVSVHFPYISEHYLKIAEDDRRRSEGVSIMHQEI